VVGALERLSGDAQTFLDKVWARQTHVHRDDAGDLSALLTLDDVDHLVTGTALRTPSMRMAMDGKVLAATAYTTKATLAGEPLTGLVDGRKVLDLFEQGATLVLQGLHRYWAPLTDLIRSLEVELGHPCQANAYLTPPGSQGFALHKDSHDVFVFQTAGRKQWEVHDSVGRHDVLMEPGVSMYLPTGTPHAAKTEQSVSLHVTVGINQLTWRGVLERSVATLLDEPEFADAIPAGYVEDRGIAAEPLAAKLQSLGEKIAELDARALVDREAARLLGQRPSALRGALVDRMVIAEIADDTLVQRRAGSVCVIEPQGEQLLLLLGDRTLTVPGRLASALDYVQEQQSFRPRDLDEFLDAESRIVLVKRLVREGLLKVRD
jgi:lysine-specific demethylase/histidyl-hydroxylase NO66